MVEGNRKSKDGWSKAHCFMKYKKNVHMQLKGERDRAREERERERERDRERERKESEKIDRVRDRT